MAQKKVTRKVGEPYAIFHLQGIGDTDMVSDMGMTAGNVHLVISRGIGTDVLERPSMVAIEKAIRAHVKDLTMDDYIATGAVENSFYVENKISCLDFLARMEVSHKVYKAMHDAMGKFKDPLVEVSKTKITRDKKAADDPAPAVNLNALFNQRKNARARSADKKTPANNTPAPVETTA